MADSVRSLRRQIWLGNVEAFEWSCIGYALSNAVANNNV